AYVRDSARPRAGAADRAAGGGVDAGGSGTADVICSIGTRPAAGPCWRRPRGSESKINAVDLPECGRGSWHRLAALIVWRFNRAHRFETSGAAFIMFVGLPTRPFTGPERYGMMAVR